MPYFDDGLLEERVHYTPIRSALFGSFNLSKSQIPFFQSVVPLGSLVSELKLVEDLPSDLRANWRLEELFQREIDWERVKSEIVDSYLRRQNKLKFFNSLTVALLPLDAQRTLDAQYGETPFPPAHPEGLDTSKYKVVDVGGVQLIRSRNNASGYFRWDSNRIFPATIDGQHRLAALKELVKAGGLTQAQLDTSVSVMFLVLDSRAGMVLDGLVMENENSLLRIVREIFIDLNMHSRSVARSRKILLDDQEIESLCLRRLLADRIGEDSADKLPLGLVHWQHNVTAKFNTGPNTGPFITTVELLNLILKDVLDLQRPKDPLDEGQVRKFVASIEDSIRVSAHISKHSLRYSNLVPLQQYVDEHHLREGYEQPFVNPAPAYLRACADSFDEMWRPLFVQILTRFKPYKDFIERVRSAGGIDGDLGYYMALPERQQKQQRDEWGESLPEVLTNPLKMLADLKTAEWPFYAVFQKALFRATKVARSHFGSIGSKAKGREFVACWLEFLDEMYSRGLFKVQCYQDSRFIWTGIGINTESRSVKWSEAAVSRISGLLILWWYFYVNELEKPGGFLKALGNSTGPVSYPVGKKSYDQLVKGLAPVFRASETVVDEDKLSKQIEACVKTLISYAKNNRAKDSIDLEPDPEMEAAISKAISEIEPSDI